MAEDTAVETSKKMTFEDVKDWVLACYNEADEGKKTRESLQTASWRTYFNEYDFSKKADWQSKISVPAWAMGVDQASGAVKQALRNSSRLFTIEVLNPSDMYAVALAKFLSDALHELLRQAEAAVVLGDGVRVNLITNIQAHKCSVRETSIDRLAPILMDVPVTSPDGTSAMEKQLQTEVVTEKKMFLDIPVINPKNMYLDPLGRNLYRIHRVQKDKAFLSDPTVKKLYRKIAVDAVLQSKEGTAIEEDEVRRDLQITNTANAYRPQVEIMEYWGPVYNKAGELVFRNKWISLFNRNYVALMEPYPFWHGADPFAVGNLIRVPFTPYGKMLYQHVGPIGSAITELVCMLTDSAKFGALNAFGIDTSLLEDVTELADGMFPGITLSMTGPNGIQELKFQGVNPTSFQLFGELMQLHQNYSGMTEFLAGQPSSRGRATATETTVKTQQSAAFFESMATDIEDYVFEPMLEKCYWNMIQFFDNWDQPMMAAIAQKHDLSPAVLGASSVQRYQLLKGSFKFHAVGMSAVLRRAETLEKLLRLMEVLGNRPEFLQQINAGKLFERIMEAFEFEDLIAQGNQMPPVVLPTALAGKENPPAPGLQGFSLPQPQMPTLGALIQAGHRPK